MAENRRGTERRVPAASHLSKAADVPKDEVGQGSAAAAVVEAAPPAMRPLLVSVVTRGQRGLPRLIRDVANACTAHGSARARGECHSCRHGETISDDLKVWRGGKKITQKAGVGFSCFAARAHTRTHMHAGRCRRCRYLAYRQTEATLLRCCCSRPSRQFPDSVKFDRRQPVPS